MCTTNINTLAMDRQVFWQINYLHASKINFGDNNEPLSIQVKVVPTSIQEIIKRFL